MKVWTKHFIIEININQSRLNIKKQHKIFAKEVEILINRMTLYKILRTKFITNFQLIPTFKIRNKVIKIVYINF